MSIYLANIPFYTIMIMGLCSLDVLLVYIRNQVQDFTKGLVSNMVVINKYFNIPDKSSGI